ncbi:MAG: hypothetical protein M3O28_07115 [Actinomycetota bacterium]|nr:hypothetical protein [Actinomycetota bacterium]
MPDRAARPHRPSLDDDLTAVIDDRSSVEAGTRAELAATTAEVVVQAARTGADGERFVALADRVGLDTLAALWRDADPVSLPGALWALYLLRQWCQTNPEEVARMWRAGEAFAAADAVVAGMPDFADVDAVRGLADAVLAGAYGGDFGVALERAASLFRVLATGRRELAQSGSLGPREIELAARNERVAVDLIAAAALWRAGALH